MARRLCLFVLLAVCNAQLRFSDEALRRKDIHVITLASDQYLPPQMGAAQQAGGEEGHKGHVILLRAARRDIRHGGAWPTARCAGFVIRGHIYRWNWDLNRWEKRAVGKANL